jgi:hypothetical protein
MHRISGRIIRPFLISGIRPVAGIRPAGYPAKSVSVASLENILFFLIIGGSVGSYSDSPGIEVIRRHVADYIAQRYLNHRTIRQMYARVG